MRRPAPMPDRVAGITQMQQYIEISLARIIDAVQIVEELSGRPKFVFPVPAVNYAYSIPVRLLVWMERGVVHGSIVPSFRKSCREVLRELFEAAIVIGNATSAKYSNAKFFHEDVLLW